MKVKKINKMFKMLDLFYANKHAYERLKKQEEEKEDFEKYFKKEVDKLKNK